jgi:HEAT repeat protein
LNLITLLAVFTLGVFLFLVFRAFGLPSSATPESQLLLRRLAIGSGVLLLGLLGVIWIIATSDTLFRSAVPIEQRLVSFNDSIRKKAQQELLGLGAESKVEVAGSLLGALKRDDPFVRKWAAISLALIGPSARQAIPVLLQSVSDKDSGVAQASRVALNEIGVPDPEQLPALLQALQDPREAVRCEAASSLARMGPSAEGVIPILRGYIQKSTATPSCFQQALGTLLVTAPTAIPSVVELLSSGYLEVRRKAADTLSSVPLTAPSTIRPVLNRLVEESNPEIRASLTQALSMKSVPTAGRAAVLAAALRTSRMEPVRLVALEELQHLQPPPDGLETLWRDALKDPNVSVRQSAARWLRQSDHLGSTMTPVLLSMLHDSDVEVRRFSLEALLRSTTKPSEAIATIARAQRDKDPGVRCRAADVLVEWGAHDRVALTLLINDLRGSEDDARCAVDALAAAGPFEPGVVSEMIHLLNGKDRELRMRAASVLRQMGPRAREALPALERAQKDQIPGAAQAVRAIKNAPLPSDRYRRRR